MSGTDERAEWLQFGTGDDAELLLVPASPRPAQPCLCRWHRLARLTLRCMWRIGWAVQDALCGLRGHRLTRASRDVDGRNLTLYCWCAKRYRYMSEDGTEQPAGSSPPAAD